MNTLSKVYSKLNNKTELATHKVDLALDLGGLKTYASSLKGKFNSYQNKFRALDNMVREVRDEAKELDKLSDKLLKELDNQEKEGVRIAKELGVKFQDTSVGKEWERISADYLSGKYDAIKKGLVIDIS